MLLVLDLWPSGTSHLAKDKVWVMSGVRARLWAVGVSGKMTEKK